MIDMGNRFRLVCAEIELVKQPEPMPKLPVARLIGCSVYREGADKCVKKVFDRADTEMYGNKIQMKANRND